MKAGIASYKKGNITTSVLAPRLSLEGLIFKTPEGTIKPWPQKWFFSDPSADFQWKVSAPISRSTARPRGIAFKEILNVLHFDKVHRSRESLMQKLLSHFCARLDFSSS